MTNAKPVATTRKRPQLPQAVLVHRTDISEDLMVIKLEAQPGKFEFKPGQYCTLGREGVERAYSIG